MPLMPYRISPFPFRLSEKATLRHRNAHFRHKTADVWDQHPSYEIKAFGRRMVMDLENNNKFVPPDLHVSTNCKVFRSHLTSSLPDHHAFAWKLHEEGQTRSADGELLLYGQNSRRSRLGGGGLFMQRNGKLGFCVKIAWNMHEERDVGMKAKLKRV